ncbi:hypothetical protein BA953_06415 [Vibrio coralliilyticus]|uniref:DUF2799 domain-containing protein n=1 Tax=Vibrio coralliilyticus TaxID=190893 RepID=UPI000810D61D|nr:DUF2799 domain-containing protein [Vibrio coralliilyticus]ANW23887.1 hypothetical protein BA953_06415 [Vibrio coralliilyticus]
MRKLIFLMLVSTLMACVASTEQLAKEGDWYEIGYQDGVRGQAQRPFKELASLGSVKQGDYDQGYLSGIKEYCNPNVAYQIGLTGQYYEGVCEGTADAQKFRMEWKRGWDEHANEYY